MPERQYLSEIAYGCYAWFSDAFEEAMIAERKRLLYSGIDSLHIYFDSAYCAS